MQSIKTDEFDSGPGNQYFSGYVPEAKAGEFHKFVINDRLFPDPAVRAQYGVRKPDWTINN